MNSNVQPAPTVALARSTSCGPESHLRNVRPQRAGRQPQEHLMAGTRGSLWGRGGRRLLVLSRSRQGAVRRGRSTNVRRDGSTGTSSRDARHLVCRPRASLLGTRRKPPRIGDRSQSAPSQQSCAREATALPVRLIFELVADPDGLADVIRAQCRQFPLPDGIRRTALVVAAAADFETVSPGRRSSAEAMSISKTGSVPPLPVSVSTNRYLWLPTTTSNDCVSESRRRNLMRRFSSSHGDRSRG